jgi:hypothetical protein
MSNLHAVKENNANADGFWAYDYESQKWVTGVPAIHLLIAQTKAELYILASDQGGEYWNMIREKGADKSCYDYVIQLEKLLISYLDILMNQPTGGVFKMIKKVCDKCSGDEFRGLYCENCGEEVLTNVYAVVEGTGPYFIHAIFEDKGTAKGHAESLNALWYPPKKTNPSNLLGSDHVKVLAFVLNKYFSMSPVKAEQE